MAHPLAEGGELTSRILDALDKAEPPLLSTETFPTYDSNDVKAALDRLASRLMVEYETTQREEVHLEPEGELIAAHGSHEARVFEALRAAVDGLTIQELEKTIGDKTISKLGQGKAFKEKWITKTKGRQDMTPGIVIANTFILDGKLAAVPDSIHDAAREQLLSIKTSRTVADQKVLADLKKRKLVRVQKVIGFKIYKGSKFALELPDEATDLTAEMLATTSWKTATFKPYNFQALGAEQRAGALHPLNKVRTEIRNIFFELGFQEMPTDSFVESGFWNFDALFFYTSDPAIAGAPSDHPYWENVKAIHQGGKYGSIGYRKGPDGRPPPARYFSIDRVFRNESVDNTHLAEFHQVEGIIADYDLTLGGLMEFMDVFFGKMGITGLKYKPAYNPYTEPSMEIFSYHPGLGKIVEIGNSGIFRPEMLEAMGLPKEMRVYGWGLSLERPTMIRYGINNIRDLLGHKVDLSFVQKNPAVQLDKA
ncbi:hypothetical protein EKO27_g4136 [Xylaria grammica]|uniref:phenylalanine--tRNA ligase n=1 Tax=Xylaria grammica TaxID=363999 RepID=A0A439D9C0_9PEZI|nr:hypothetical protein EKO27_g4136 [Xylaria grammica]